jgi:hypothetical protein
MLATALPQLLIASDVATWLWLTTRQVERMAKAGQIPSRRLPNGDLVFDVAELRRWAASLPRPLGDIHAA